VVQEPAWLEHCRDCDLRYVRNDSADEQHHREYHDERIDGPKTAMSSGLYLVSSSSNICTRKLAAQAAIHAKRDAGYDFPAYTVDEQNAEDQPLALIAVAQERVVGLIVTSYRVCQHRTTVAGLSEPTLSIEDVPPSSRRAIEMIWVLKKCRRAGLARRLVTEVCRSLQVSLKEVAHVTPFTDDALQFWQSFSLHNLFVV
jgi:ribosomal protein S18 acetylase RimI-like enzyme